MLVHGKASCVCVLYIYDIYIIYIYIICLCLCPKGPQTTARDKHPVEPVSWRKIQK